VGRTGYQDTSGAVDGAPPVDMAGSLASFEVGKHLKHVDQSWYQTGGATGGNSCNLCHDGAGSGTANHGNIVVDIKFHPNASNPGCIPGTDCADFVDPGTLTAGTCTNLACHGNAVWDPAYTPPCDFCHSFPPTSNKHTEHLTSAALASLTEPKKCSVCHNTTVNSLGEIIAGGSHANSSYDVAFDANYGYEGGAASSTGAGNLTVCQNVRCHNGALTTPTWDAGSTIVCGQCHGDGSGPLPSDAGTAGSHAAHADNNTTDFSDCERCHPGAVDYTAMGDPLGQHQNLAVEVTPYSTASTGIYTELTGGGGVNYAGPDGTDNGRCQGTYCHVQNIPIWGAAGSVVCGDCHGTKGRTGYLDATGAVDGAPPRDMLASNPATSYEVGKHLNHVKQATRHRAIFATMEQAAEPLNTAIP